MQSCMCIHPHTVTHTHTHTSTHTHASCSHSHTPSHLLGHIRRDLLHTQGPLSHLKQLRTLRLDLHESFVRMETAGLAGLVQQLGTVCHLSLSAQEIAGQRVLLAAAAPTLRSLSLRAAHIDAGALRELEAAPHLRMLDISWVYVDVPSYEAGEEEVEEEQVLRAKAAVGAASGLKQVTHLAMDFLERALRHDIFDLTHLQCIRIGNGDGIIAPPITPGDLMRVIRMVGPGCRLIFDGLSQDQVLAARQAFSSMQALCEMLASHPGTHLSVKVLQCVCVCARARVRV